MDTWQDSDPVDDLEPQNVPEDFGANTGASPALSSADEPQEDQLPDEDVTDAAD